MPLILSQKIAGCDSSHPAASRGKARSGLSQAGKTCVFRVPNAQASSSTSCAAATRKAQEQEGLSEHRFVTSTSAEHATQATSPSYCTLETFAVTVWRQKAPDRPLRSQGNHAGAQHVGFTLSRPKPKWSALSHRWPRRRAAVRLTHSLTSDERLPSDPGLWCGWAARGIEIQGHPALHSPCRRCAESPSRTTRIVSTAATGSRSSSTI